ncbi:MAG: hypothetical protein IJ419_06445 [Agathobacter sp.]|nr:hypothetical protein [Agathobacter sp.]
MYNHLRKELLGATIALAKTCGNNPKTENTDRIIIEALVAVRTEDFEETMLEKKLEMVRQEKHIIAPNCSTCAHPCGNTVEYDLDLLKKDDDECRELKEQLLKEIQELAVEFYRAMLMHVNISKHMEIFYKVLEVVTYRMETENLESILEEIREKKQEL